MVSNNWTLSSNELAISVTIPPGSVGMIYVPTLGTDTNDLSIDESGVAVWQNGTASGAVNGVNFDHIEAGITPRPAFIVFAVQSGTYQFAAHLFLPPDGVSASAGIGQVSLNWSAVTGASGYKIKRSLTSGGSYARLQLMWPEQITLMSA